MTSGSVRAACHPPRVHGKFLNAENGRFLVKGVAYGTFAPNGDGHQFPSPERINQDFMLMAAAGINTVRTYTVPPPDLLDIALRHGLRVMVGLAWPQHISFLDDPQLARQIRHDAANAVRRLVAHPATLMFAVGNEIPAGIVRWHGHRRIERFLRELYENVKAAAPDSLLTYVNFPPTEHLDLECFDVCAFNVYLHREPDLRGYLARLQHIAGARPLLLAEAGADSVRQGLEGQARITTMHVRAAFMEGACGAIVYSWTDEWWRGGRSVDDWAFGLVDDARQPKPALAAVSEAFAESPVSARERHEWPKVSVVVCAFNAADTIDDCLSSLTRLTYPSVEVIVVNDGSRDATASIARRHAGVRVIDTPNGGLSAARNVGLAAATGEIVAYTDADARVDPDWLTYLVQPMLLSDVAGAGGPNVVPPDDPWVAQCVARAPGGPSHVMLDDRIAEHVPGCNMAFRRDALLSIDGFNPVYLRAGDDVDICWRLQARGLRIGFAPAALVWHHHRPSVKAYWHQQVGYGEGEAWLDAHHPEKFLGRPDAVARPDLQSAAVSALGYRETRQHRRLGHRRVSVDLQHAYAPMAVPSSFTSVDGRSVFAVDRRHCGLADGGRDLVGSLHRRHARLDDHCPAVCDVCVEVRSQRPAVHRPVVAHAKPASLPRVDRLVAPGAAHCAVLGKSTGTVAVARGCPSARHAPSLEDACTVAPQCAGSRTAVDWRPQRVVVLE